MVVAIDVQALAPDMPGRGLRERRHDPQILGFATTEGKVATIPGTIGGGEQDESPPEKLCGKVPGFAPRPRTRCIARACAEPAIPPDEAAYSSSSSAASKGQKN